MGGLREARLYLGAPRRPHQGRHLHLFPALLAAAERTVDEACGAPSPDEVRAAVERLREDHDFFMRELAGTVGALRELTPRAAHADSERLLETKTRVLAVARRLEEHNGVEERQVYRWRETLLSGSGLDALDAEMRREIENLPPRFTERPKRR